MTVANAQDIGSAKDIAAQSVRVFVGLKVATEIVAQLVRFAAGFESPAVRLVAPADIHLTLVPPWNEPATAEAIAQLGRIAGQFGAFVLTFQHVGYGPQPERPRLIWVDCAASDDVTALRAALLQAFGQVDERPFQPHVTLARIRGNGLAIARRYPTDAQLSLEQRVESVELFQSPPPGERGYRILASSRFDLNQAGMGVSMIS